MSNAVRYWMLGVVTGMLVVSFDFPIGFVLIVLSGGIGMYFDTRKLPQPTEAKL